jgi:Mg2+ and Co2+ transporter CorA
VLLREDGSAAAILLAVEDIETDMQSVSGWLQNSDVSELTLSVQQDIIDSLRQLIETTQKELQNMQNSNQQSQPSQPGTQQQRLVELMAEIKVLRNLQLQVNRRTKQVDSLVPAADATALTRLEAQIRELAERQQRLLETAKDLAKEAKKDGP